jgi:uncharacterized membrane protein
MKKMIVALVWSLAVALWIGIFVYKSVADPTTTEWTAAVIAGALSLEVAFWVTAAVLGISLLQSRKAVLGFFTRPFRRSDR